ncbi:PBSX family phage terminase large subunit [Leptolyngbya ohadii]|uniref:PBSX family phage terminase large subunit n=1 Tax=Leptolyngbya ohadii TaxID=1962290 RepID=UPI0019D4DE1F|nr:PBSX family phage terminase large subunit [Leptolyngbya ohadii]
MASKAALSLVHGRMREQAIAAVSGTMKQQREKSSAGDRVNLAAKLVEGLTDWAKPLMQPKRYKCLYGGRGSGKSYAVADALLITGLTRKIRVLCAREFQNSIKDSVHALLKERIAELKLESFYRVQEAAIVGVNGSQFIFKGVRLNVQSVKSMSGLTHCWIEEGQTISAESWQVLIPTIREEGSEVWVTFNPLNESDTVYQELVATPRSNAYVERVNWDRNPHFPKVLDDERRHMQATDPDAYYHIWEGGFWEKSDAQILAGKWVVDDFEPGEDWNGPYFGADFGFAKDPTTLVKCWVHGNRLYIERESYAVGLEIDCTADRWKLDVPGCENFVVRADSARPDSISYLKRHGIHRIEGAAKRANSVEDGIAHLRSYEKIVIHPRCKRTAEEARLYSYKTDRLTGDVLPIVLDAHNHCIDSLRYALEPMIRPIAPVRRYSPTVARNW